MFFKNIFSNTKSTLSFLGIVFLVAAVSLGAYFIFLEQSFDDRGRTYEDEDCLVDMNGSISCETVDQNTINVIYSYTNAYVCHPDDEPIRIEDNLGWVKNLPEGDNSGTEVVTDLEPNTRYYYYLRIGTSPHFRQLGAVSCTTLEEEIEPDCGELAREYPHDTTEWPSEEFCAEGDVDPSNPTFPSPGGRTNWECKVNENSVTCTATRNQAPAPLPEPEPEPEPTPEPEPDTEPEPEPELPSTGNITTFSTLAGSLLLILGILLYKGKIDFMNRIIFKIINTKAIKKRLMSKQEYFEDSILEEDE